MTIKDLDINVGVAMKATGVTLLFIAGLILFFCYPEECILAALGLLVLVLFVIFWCKMYSVFLKHEENKKSGNTSDYWTDL